MIVGNNKRTYLNDIKYNLNEDHIDELMKVKKFLCEQNSKVPKYMGKNFEKEILPSLYNLAKGEKINTNYFKDMEDVNDMEKKDVVLDMSVIAEMAKAGDTDMLQNIIQSIKKRYDYASWEEQKEKENPGSGKRKETEKQTEKFMDKLMEEDGEEDEPTDSDEEGEINKKKKEFLEDIIKENKKISDTLKSKPNYAEFLKWLDKMKEADSNKKKLFQVEKMSEMSKIPISEFGKPKILMLKRMVNREYYIRKNQPVDKFMEVCTDDSGSMGDYFKHRQTALVDVFNACKDRNIKFNHMFFVQTIDKNPIDIKSEAELYDIVSKYPGGSENIYISTFDKLKSMEKKQNKQYLLFISDGTATIPTTEMGKTLQNMAEEKNIDLKYVLFSEENEMHGIDRKNIFYIFSNELSSDSNKINDETDD